MKEQENHISLENPEDVRKLQYQVNTDMRQEIRELFLSLLMLRGKDLPQKSKWRRMLPVSLEHIFDCCAGEAELCEADWEAYRSGLHILTNLAPPELLQEYVDLAQAFPVARVKEVCKHLLEVEEWGAAFSLYQTIPVEDADADFWLQVGICLYHLGEYAAADEALGRAEEMGCRDGRIAAHRLWIAERSDT